MVVSIHHELRHAVRRALAAPAFSLAVILTFALGVGLNALAFGGVRAVLLNPLPFPAAERLVNVWQTQPGQPVRSVAPANFLDWRAASSFEALAAYNVRRRSLVTPEPQRIDVATVSANFFDVLGVRPMVGRSFDRTPAPGERRDILLREDFWRSAFGGDRTLPGRAIVLDDEVVTVVGIIPTRLAFPEEALAWTQGPHDIPELGIGGDVRRIRDARYFAVIGRLKAGVTIPGAQAEMDVIAERLRAQYPEENAETGARVGNLQSELTGASAPMLWLLFGAAGCVLAIACANVAGLFVAAAISRRRELRVRTVLGASRGRLARQLVLEAMVLACAGGAVGVGIAAIARSALVALLPAATPRLQTISVDYGVLAVSAIVVLVAGAIFGGAPALLALRGTTGLGDRSAAGASRVGARTTSALVAAQLALALVLISGSGLMARTLWLLYQRDPGMDLERVLVLDVALPDARSRGREAAVLAVQRMVERLSALPGASGAGAIQSLPLASRGPSAGLRVEGRTFGRNEAPDVSWRAVTPGYFPAIGATLLRGRWFDDGDGRGTPPVAVINATLARLLWPDSDPLGARIGTGLDGDGAPVTVVGIVGDIAQDSLRAPVRPEMYRPLAQPSRFPVLGMSLVVRADADPLHLAEAARGAVREVHPRAPVAGIRTLEAVAARGLATERSLFVALAVFGGLAIVLAAVGLYGTLSRIVGDRRREFGIRLAMGAPPQHVQRLVLRRTALVGAVGCVLGLAGSVMLGRQLRGLLYGVSGVDPVVFAASLLVLIAAALLASALPARRAASIDPLDALRTE